MNGAGPSVDPSRDARHVEAALRRRERAQLLRQWLRPGVGVKRWLVPVFIGLLLIALAVAGLLRMALADRPADDPLHNIVEALTLQSLPPELRWSLPLAVTVADDGGSSGKLRTELGMPPMGDIRNCIAALADTEPAMARLLSYRFPLADSVDSSYAGHAFGNLLIAALTAVTGDFEEGVRQSNRVLAVRGSVVPVAGQPVTLHAALIDGSVMEGQSEIARKRGIRRVWITPEDARPSAEAVQAIASADLIVIGPGSLYTSLLPPLLVPGIHEALARAAAPRLLVCNVATQVGETEEFALTDHLEALASHGMSDVIDAVLVNDNFKARQPANYPAAPVNIDLPLSSKSGPQIIARDVVDDDNAHRHDSRKLASVLLTLYDERAIARRRARVATKA
jgi:uncharacterized cofD-like protein